MSLIGAATVVGLLAVAVLVWFYLRQHNSDQLVAIENRRKPEARIVERADYVEGMQHIPVVLSLTNSAIFYENVDLQAQLDLAKIDEVEYDDELATGTAVAAHGRVLRLRSHGHTIEFVVPRESADKWLTNLPGHRMGEPGTVHTS